MTTPELRIEWQPSGRNGSATLTARLGDQTLAHATVNMAKPKARSEFVQQVKSKAPAVDEAALEAELLRIAPKLVGSENSAAALGDGLGELDTSCIVRPERFITPEVSGLAVPTMTTVGEKPVGRWLLYLRWSDGKRERRILPSSLDLPEGRRLWIHPTPGEPTANTAAGWSKESRDRWLQGEPAPSPLEVFKAISERIATFVYLPKDHAPGITTTLGLWVMLAYCYRAWPAVPYLYVGGPLGSGKSRVFELLGQIAFRPLASANMSAPALFRTLHAQGGTLLLDEAERLRDAKSPEVQELLSMLLAGYKRGGQATRLEPFGDSFRMTAFDVYSPKALACIAGLPPALASRTIALQMFRAPPDSPIPRRRIDAEPHRWQSLRDNLHSLALEHGPTWLELAERVDVCPSMGGRDFELWQPLLALAAWLEEQGAKGLLSLMRSHAQRSIEVAREDATPEADEVLLRHFADAMRSGERITPHELLDRAVKGDPITFRSWTAAGVSRRIRHYGIPAPQKSGGRREWRSVADGTFQQIQTAYGIDLGFASDAAED
jgi:hypothetical protein